MKHEADVYWAAAAGLLRTSRKGVEARLATMTPDEKDRLRKDVLAVLAGIPAWLAEYDALLTSDNNGIPTRTIR